MTSSDFVNGFLNLLAAIIFGIYTSNNFAKQTGATKPSVVASFFRISDYVKLKSVRAYATVFGIMNAALLFVALEIIALSPDVLQTLNKFVLKNVGKIVGSEFEKIAVDIHKAINPYYLPFIVSWAMSLLLLPQIKLGVSLFRTLSQYTLQFQNNAQILVDDAFYKIQQVFPMSELEGRLEDLYERAAPRPRQISNDPQFLAKYQLLYFASIDAGHLGLDKSLKIMVERLGASYELESEIQWFNVWKIISGCCHYVVVAAFFMLIAKKFPQVFDEMLGLSSWPPLIDLFIELTRWTFQIVAPLLLATALYEMNLMANISRDRVSERKQRFFVFQLLYGISVGLIYHFIDILRSNQGAIPSFDQYFAWRGILIAVAPSLVGPIMLNIWSSIPSENKYVLVIKIFAISLIGGLGLLSLDVFSKSILDTGGSYQTNEFLVGVFIFGLAFSLWFILHRREPKTIPRHQPIAATLFMSCLMVPPFWMLSPMA